MTSVTDTQPTPQSIERRSIPLRIIIMGVVVLAVGVYIGTQVLGVLFGVIAPPAPPLPGNLTEVEHISTDYGSDEWLYTSAQHPCEVAQVYINAGGQCEFAPQWCREGGGTQPDSYARITPGDHVGRCMGVTSFSIFAQRWQVLIATIGSSGAEGASFRVVRDVLWAGDQLGPAPISLPVATPGGSP